MSASDADACCAGTVATKRGRVKIVPTIACFIFTIKSFVVDLLELILVLLY